jgi:DNA primase catalytic subunit
LFDGFVMEEMMEYEYNAHINKQQHQQKEQLQTQLSVSDVHQRRRPKKKPLSIHDAAQAGDVKSLQSKLEEDTGLINSRNPIMTETPLHRAAASNEVDAVKFLLEWQGAEKVELETKNMVRNSFFGLSHLLSLKLCLTNVGSSLSHILLQHEWLLQQICIAGFAE